MSIVREKKIARVLLPFRRGKHLKGRPNFSVTLITQKPEREQRTWGMHETTMRIHNNYTDAAGAYVVS